MAEIVAERITSVAIKTLKGLLHKKTRLCLLGGILFDGFYNSCVPAPMFYYTFQ